MQCLKKNILVNKAIGAWCCSLFVIIIMTFIIIDGCNNLGNVLHVNSYHKSYEPWTSRDPTYCQKMKNYGDKYYIGCEKNENPVDY